MENNNSLNILDLIINKSIDQFGFKAYGKSTTTNIIIHGELYYPYSQKWQPLTRLFAECFLFPLNKTTDWNKLISSEV